MFYDQQHLVTVSAVSGKADKDTENRQVKLVLTMQAMEPADFRDYADKITEHLRIGCHKSITFDTAHSPRLRLSTGDHPSFDAVQIDNITLAIQDGINIAKFTILVPLEDDAGTYWMGLLGDEIEITFSKTQLSIGDAVLDAAEKLDESCKENNTTIEMKYRGRTVTIGAKA